MTGLPQQVQDQLKQLDDLQSQLQGLMQQRMQVEAQTEELKRTIGALGEAEEGAAVYRSVGSVLIEVKDPDTLKGELEERPDDLALLTRLAHLYHDAAMFPEAIAFYERATKIDSGAIRVAVSAGR